MFQNDSHLSLCMQLHAVVVHRGEEHGGHYWTYIWDNSQQVWFHIDDNFTHQVTWDTIVNSTFGGVEHESSARCLIYLDSLQTDSLLGNLPFLKDYKDC